MKYHKSLLHYATPVAVALAVAVAVAVAVFSNKRMLDYHL